LRKQGWTKYNQICATISSGSGPTFNVQLLFLKLQQNIFNWAFVPGWTFNEFPAFADTQRYAASYHTTRQTMSEDNLYLLFCYLIYGLTLLAYVVRAKKKIKTATINLVFLALYSGIFLYNLTYNSSKGSGLAWLVYLMFAIGLHWLINFVGLLLTFRMKR
jgi:hypothetical protein